MLYGINTKEKHDNTIKELLKIGFRFPNNTTGWDFERAKSCYHGNSKLLLHTFHNYITDKNEMQYITRAAYLSWPQYSNKTFREEYVEDYFNRSMNKIIERLDKWNDSKIWDNGKIILINCCVMVLNDEFEHKYETLAEETKGGIERIFKMTEDYAKTLDIPSVEEIKAGIFEIAGRRWSKKVKYSFGEGLPVVNARFMLDIIQYLEVYEIKWDSVHKPILFQGERGVAILMPLRKESSVDDLEKGYYILVN